MKNRKFKIISGMVYVPQFEKSPDLHDVGNSVEFIEVTERDELGEKEEVEIRPSLIKNPKDKLEEFYNEWADMEGTIIRPKKLMYELIELGVVGMG